MPAVTLDVYNFFNKQAMATKLVTFPKIYLGTIWHSKCLSIKFGVTMTNNFLTGRFSQNFEFSPFD